MMNKCKEQELEVCSVDSGTAELMNNDPGDRSMNFIPCVHSCQINSKNHCNDDQNAVFSYTLLLCVAGKKLEPGSTFFAGPQSGFIGLNEWVVFWPNVGNVMYCDAKFTQRLMSIQCGQNCVFLCNYGQRCSYLYFYPNFNHTKPLLKPNYVLHNNKQSCFQLDFKD